MGPPRARGRQGRWRKGDRHDRPLRHPVCDSGEIIAQYRTALSPDDSVDDIAEKEHVLEMEHFPKVVEQVINETFFC